MKIPLRLLIVEDSEDDALLLVRVLQKGGYDPAYERVETADAMGEALERQEWDIIISDYSMPQFSGSAALALHKEKGTDIPFIIVSGAIGEETAVAAMVSGARDYVMKHNLTRLVPAVQRELKEAKSRRDRRQADEALRVSELRYKVMSQIIPDFIYSCIPGDDGTYVVNWATDGFTAVTGYPIDTFRGKACWIESTVHPEDIAIAKEQVESLESNSKNFRYFRIITREGNIKWIRNHLELITDEKAPGSFVLYGAVQDVTGLKEAEREIITAAEQWRTTFDSIADSIMILDNDFKIVRVNKSTSALIGLPIDKVLGNRCYTIMHQTNGPIGTCPHLKMRETNEHVETEIYFDDSGKWFHITIDPMFNDAGELVGAVHVMKDMTERRNMEEQVQRSEQKYRSIHENAIEGIFQMTPEGRIFSGNPALVKMFEYNSIDELMQNVDDLSKDGYVNPEEMARYKQVIKEQGTVKGFEAEHYKKNGDTMWISINTRSIYDDTGKLRYYEGTIVDITERKRAEGAARETLEHLKNAIQSIIDTVSAVLEARDPYTSGHQKKVSSIAVATARQMGLPELQIEGIQTAGVIHDLGKISIPAEILSKPSKLSELELSLMKTHPLIGYDILKKIEFPWPIALIILQHHERLDGSGYPQGLKDGQILLEARILAVADVVEAMASHRPYRPALGIEAALEEIEKNKGVLYDAGVVDVCLKLFREQGFTLE